MARELRDEDLPAEYERYLEAVRNYSAQTVKSYVRDVKAYVAWCDDLCLPPRKAQHADIRRYLSELTDRGYARRTIARKLSSVRTFYTAAEREPGRDRREPQGGQVSASRAHGDGRRACA